MFNITNEKKILKIVIIILVLNEIELLVKLTSCTLESFRSLLKWLYIYVLYTFYVQLQTLNKLYRAS